MVMKRYFYSIMLCFFLLGTFSVCDAKTLFDVLKELDEQAVSKPLPPKQAKSFVKEATSAFNVLVQAIQKEDIEVVFGLDRQQASLCRLKFKSERERYLKNFSERFKNKAYIKTETGFLPYEVRLGPEGYEPKVFFSKGAKVEVIDAIASSIPEGYRVKLQIRIKYTQENAPYYVDEIDVDYTGGGIKPIPLYYPTIFEHSHPFSQEGKFRNYKLKMQPRYVGEATIVAIMDKNPELGDKWLFREVRYQARDLRFIELSQLTKPQPHSPQPPSLQPHSPQPPSSIPKAILDALNPYLREEENKYLDKSIDNQGREYSVVLTSKELDFDGIKRRLSMRGGQLGSVKETDIIAYPMELTASGYKIEQEKALEIIDNLSIKHLAQEKVVLPYDIDEMTISNYKNSWISEMRNLIENLGREPDKKVLYRKVFREMLSTQIMGQEDLDSLAVDIINAVDQVARNYSSAEVITSIPKGEIIKKIMELRAEGVNIPGTLPMIKAPIDRLYFISAGIKWIGRATTAIKGLVYISTPVVFVEKLCQNLEKIIPYLDGDCKIAAQEVLSETRQEITMYKNKAYEWWDAEVRKAVVTDITPEIISSQCKLWKIPGIGDVFLGIAMAWKGTKFLTNTDKILDEMHLANQAAWIQEEAKNEWLRLRKEIKDGEIPSLSIIENLRAVYEIYILSGIVGNKHLSRAFNAQDNDLLSRIFTRPDDLSAQYQNISWEMMRALVEWENPILVEKVYQNLISRILAIPKLSEPDIVLPDFSSPTATWNTIKMAVRKKDKDLLLECLSKEERSSKGVLPNIDDLLVYGEEGQNRLLNSTIVKEEFVNSNLRVLRVKIGNNEEEVCFLLEDGAWKISGEPFKLEPGLYSRWLLWNIFQQFPPNRMSLIED